MAISLSGARPMLSGRLPTGTSFSGDSWNLSTSLAISVTSAQRLFLELPAEVARPAAQSVEPAIRPDPNAQDHHRGVVFAAVFIRQRDEAVGGCLRGKMGEQCAGDFRIGDHARQPIRAKQQSVAFQ